MTSSQTVWILWHLPPGGDPDDGMLIGVYGSKASAMTAVDRLSAKPGFRDHPGVTGDDQHPGFFMQPYQLDKDQWSEGYVTFTDAD